VQKSSKAQRISIYEKSIRKSLTPETCKIPWLWRSLALPHRRHTYIVDPSLSPWWCTKKLGVSNAILRLYQFTVLLGFDQTDLESNTLIWSAQGGKWFLRHAIYLAFLFFRAGLTVPANNFFWWLWPSFGWGLCGSTQRYHHLMDVFDVLKPRATKFFCRDYAGTFYSDRNDHGKWSHSSILQDISEITL